MKFASVAVLVFAVSLGFAFEIRKFPSTFGIKEDIDDFLNLIPQDKVVNIVISYLAIDEEVQATLQYILSDDFKGILTNLESITEYREFLAYLQSNGLNVYYYLQKLHDFIGMDPFQPKRFLRSNRREPGVRGMLNEIEKILPIKQLQDMYDEKMKTSPAFANLIAQMSSEDFQGIVDEMRANPDFQELIATAKSHGVDVELIHEILHKIFGW